MADDVGFLSMADGREVAFRVMSDREGAVVVHTPTDPVPIDLLREDPMYERFVQTLGAAGRLVVYDTPGVGSSDPLDPDRDGVEQISEAYLSILELMEADAGWIVGSSMVDIAEIVRAHRNRVRGVVLIGRTRGVRQELSRAMTRERQSSAEYAAELFPSRADDPAFLDWLGRARRLAVSTSALAANAMAARADIERFGTEVRPIEDAPPVLLIRRRGAMGEAAVEWYTHIFPNLECITIDGIDLGIPALDAGLIAEMAAEFITGTPVSTPARRDLVAMLFTDLVDSTPAAAASGDTVWRSTLDRYETVVERTIRRHHGTVVKHTGDGALATFRSGTDAVAAAIELRSSTHDLELESRTGIHLGEVELRDDDINGIGVVLAARVMDAAEPGEILVSSSVEQTTVGGQLRFEDRGSRTLKGIDRPWQLFAVQTRPQPPES